MVHERRGDLPAAVECAERGVREDPTVPQLHKNLGDCLYRSARYDEAQDAYLRATKLAPNLGGDIYFKLGNIRYKRQEKIEAIAYWEQALTLDPANQLVRTNLDLVRTAVA
jgi:tetratricopeptide (TPR) repeat protein